MIFFFGIKTSITHVFTIYRAAVVTEWVAEQHVLISVEKTEAVVVSLNPRETAGKPITAIDNS